MARRSDHSQEEIRQMAIQAGKEIIEREGFSALSARKVALKIGYTVGTLYNVFTSLDDLLLHIKALTLDEMAVFISQNTKDQISGVAAIKKLATLYLNFASQHYQSWSFLFEKHLPPDISIPLWYEKKVNKLFTLVEKQLLPLMKNNQEQGERAAIILWSSIHGICALSLTGKLNVTKAKSIQVLMDELIENYLAGVTFKKGGV